jgi:hypothetical protein
VENPSLKQGWEIKRFFVHQAFMGFIHSLFVDFVNKTALEPIKMIAPTLILILFAETNHEKNRKSLRPRGLILALNKPATGSSFERRLV